MKKLFTLIAVASAFTLSQAQSEIGGVKYDDGIAKKWEFKFDGGYTNDFDKYGEDTRGLNGNDGWGVNVGVGYNFNSNVFFGVNSGYYGSFGKIKGQEDGSNVIPLLADLVYRWNLGTAEKWSVFLEGRGGYLFSLSDDVTYRKQNHEVNGYYYADAQAGIYYRIRRNIDMKFALGWGYGWNREEDAEPSVTFNEHPFSARVGFNFRGKPTTATRAALLDESARLASEAEAARLALEEANRRVAELKAQKDAADEAVARLAAEKAAAEKAAAEALAKAKEHDMVFFYNIRDVELSAEDNVKLQQLAEFVKNHEISQIYIKGYADRGTGTPAVNKRYAKQRAENLKKKLVNQYGIDSKIIECISYGDTVQPYAENDKNRCATIYVQEMH